MKISPTEPRRATAFAMPVAVVALASYHALPTLLAAWGSDLYSRGAPLGFALWLALVGVMVFKQTTPTQASTVWMLVALGLCVGGAMGGLRILHHLALAASLVAFLGGFPRGLFAMIAAVSWLPASGWFLSHLKMGGLSGWERPLAALLLCSPLLVFLRYSHRPASHSKS